MFRVTVIPWESSPLRDFRGWYLQFPHPKGEHWGLIQDAKYEDECLVIALAWVTIGSPHNEKGKKARLDPVIIKPLSKGPVYEANTMVFGIKDRETLVEYTIMPSRQIIQPSKPKKQEERQPNKVQPKKRRVKPRFRPEFFTKAD